MIDYQAFLQSKRRVFTGDGMAVDSLSLPAMLFPWQAAIVRWALRKGKAAIFADCGLGKSFMQLAWAEQIPGRVLILAPLCVAEQTVDEGRKLGVPVVYARHSHETNARIVITNYERLDDFDPSAFAGVVLDESSILKAFDGKTRTKLIQTFKATPYRLCCTATPSPNDIAELGNHAEFLGLMTRVEFLATWFIKIDQGIRTTEHHGWRLKRHAVTPFYRWLASWAVALRSPADLGYDDAGYRLPLLTIQERVLTLDAPMGDALFPEMGAKGLSGRLAARRTSLHDRVREVSSLVRSPGAWLLWCGLNEESVALSAAIPGAIEVKGSDTYAEKVGAVKAFMRGDTRVLVSKAKILGFGLNFQHCHQMAFVGLSDSYESYYQCIRRCWRFGQTSPVDVFVIVSEAERMIVENVRRKERAAADLSGQLLAHMAEFERAEVAAA